MRCVLPHLEEPEKILNEIFSAYPQALIYIEFQELSAILETGAFWQISHDHVNYFPTNWFEQKFVKVDSGQLSEEWSWVLVGGQTHNLPDGPQLAKNGTEFLLSAMEEAKRKFMLWADSNQPLVILGAGGKGANLGFQLINEGIEVSLVDLDSSKQNRYLECSGLEVFPYSHLESEAKASTRVLLNSIYRDEVIRLTGSSNFEIFGT